MQNGEDKDSAKTMSSNDDSQSMSSMSSSVPKSVKSAMDVEAIAALKFALSEFCKQEDSYPIDKSEFPTYVYEEENIMGFKSEVSKNQPKLFKDFRFKIYAPRIFRLLRSMFGIDTNHFRESFNEIRQVQNAGASGSYLFFSQEDNFVLKSVTPDESEFFLTFLPGYLRFLKGQPRTFLPKFFGLYGYLPEKFGKKGFKFIIMNNILPSAMPYSFKFDLKGSTYKRKASPSELRKKLPTLKDLDFMDKFREGIFIHEKFYDSFIVGLEQDVQQLMSFSIMDYSLLLGIFQIGPNGAKTLENCVKKYQKYHKRTASLDNASSAWIQKALHPFDSSRNITNLLGGIPAYDKTTKTHMLLYVGIIDILQTYRFRKRFEHVFKSTFIDGDKISVTNPKFYAERFVAFMKNYFKSSKELTTEDQIFLKKESIIVEAYEIDSGNNTSAENLSREPDKESESTIKNGVSDSTPGGDSNSASSSPSTDKKHALISEENDPMNPDKHLTPSEVSFRNQSSQDHIPDPQ